ncbi:putative methyltransferase C9orf114 [Stegodyphus dumicola]|uniref:putative methyltransferase C9orf114 n=1 Tax=Stegodyphus dumicola TaxID=202533 RepID=UPI0015B2B460|nr:putative methyltransferase C9orf114 [Stegodyphus dumicola]
MAGHLLRKQIKESINVLHSVAIIFKIWMAIPTPTLLFSFINIMEKVSKNGNSESLKNRFSKDAITSGMNWKEWKKNKKEEHKKWKQEKLLKKQKKLEESKKISEENAASLSDSQIHQHYTISIAVPGSILDNAQSPELKTYLAGQIARAAAIFNVNEIIVFSEIAVTNFDDDDQALKLHKKNHGCIQMVRILQFLECPQYLRKYYFPIHKDLEYAGLLNPLDIPHHLRVDDEFPYREGIILNKPVKEGKGSYAYIGLQKTAIIDKIIEPNVRVTVKLDKEQTSKKHYKGKVVSPYAPYKCDKIYWGYNVRLAKSLSAVFSECPFKGGYDLSIGTSDKGQDVDSFTLPSFKHLLIIFGGLKGLEGCLEGDETLEANEPSELFNFYLNTCPSQGSRTIRTEEAVLITLSVLRPQINSVNDSL